MPYILTFLIAVLIAGCGGGPDRSSDVASIGASFRGEISDEGETQTFPLAIPVGTVVTITVDRLNDEMDPKVTIVDAGGNLLFVDDDGGEGVNSRLTTVITEAAHGVMVSCYEAKTGPYRLQVRGSVVNSSNYPFSSRGQVGTAGVEYIYKLEPRLLSK